MKTAMVTGCTASHQALEYLTLRPKISWAMRHGYGLASTCFKEPFSYWDRAAFILEVMEQGEYERAIWLDCDAVITNPQISVDDITGIARHAFIASLDWGPMPQEDMWWRVNAGNFIVQSITGLKKWLELKGTKFVMDPDGWAEDQAAIRHLIRMHQTSSVVCGRRKLNAVPDGSKLPDGLTFPQYTQPVEPWQPGDFLCHLSGASNEARIKVVPYFDEQRKQYE